MATLAEIAQLEDTKYFPPGVAMGARHRADTVVTPYVDGSAYFGAIADVLDGLGGPDDRLYITSWRMNTAMRLRPGPGEPDLGDRLVDLVAKRVDVRAIVAIPRYSLGTSWGPLTWNPATWDPELWREVVAFFSPLKATVQDNIASVRRLRDAGPPLSRRVLVDWGGGFDSRHEKCTIAYSSTTRILHAFVGGLDYATDRFAAEGHPGTPAVHFWHDLGVHLQGGAAEEVLANFWTRYDETATLPPRRYWYGGINRFNGDIDPKPAALKPTPGPLPANPPAGSHVDTGVRIWRSYGPLRVTGSLGDGLDLPWQTLPPTGVPEVTVGMSAAILAAQRFIYVEDQGVNPSQLAILYNHHRVLYPAISSACAAGVKVIFVTQGFSPEGIGTSDATPNTSEEIWEWIVADLPPGQQRNFVLFYRRDTKVHSKLMIVDDELVTLGSANLWDRSQLGHESEVHAAIVHPGGSSSLVADLRVRLWREHLRPPGGAADDPKLRDLDISLGYFRDTWGSGKRTDIPGSTLEEMIP
jgi:phosphatidylserine/phosphatidylglycerophosphate/cardiolipin synthase-like enzyme